MPFNDVAELETATLTVSVIGVESPVISIEQDGSDMAIHEYEARALHMWLGVALRIDSQSDRLTEKLHRIVRWLEANQPDVFKRGLWEAIDGPSSHPSAGESHGD